MKLFFLFVIASAIIFEAKDCTSSTGIKKEVTATNCSNQKNCCSNQKLKEENPLFFNQPFITFKYSL